MTRNPAQATPDNIRVMHVVARLNIGGPAALVAILADGLDPNRFNVRIFTGRVAADEAEHSALAAGDPRLRHIPSLGRGLHPVRDVRALLDLVRAMRAYRPHIVHTHTAKAGFLGRLAAKIGRVPAVVHTFHGHLLYGYFGRGGTAAVVVAERLLAHAADRLVAVGEQVRDDLLAAGIGRRSQYVVQAPAVVTPAPVGREDARRRLDLPPDAKVVSFVGRLTGIKRPDRFVALAVALAGQHPEATFLVVGGGSMLRGLRAAGRGAGEQLRFLGWQSDMDTVYAATDLVVLTSQNEGMPLTLIEAAVRGIPAVTTDVGSAGEVVRHGFTGLVVPCSVSALTDAVDAVLRDDALRLAMGSRAADEGHGRFAPDRLVAETQDLYEQLLPQR